MEIENIKFEKIPYEKEMVEHLVDQLIKLQRTYDCSNGISSKTELSHAMKTINKSLDMVLTPCLILKDLS